MSYTFDFNDEVIWSPARRVGRLYVGIAGALSEMISVPHGMSAMAEDYYEIDSAAFRGFVESVMREFSSGHPVSGALLDGFLITSSVLLERMGKSLLIDSDVIIRERVSELSHKMAQ